MTNLTEHKCKGKCPEFKGEQCNHCLVPDSNYSEIPNSLDFAVGDVVVITNHKFSDDLHTVVLVMNKPCFIHPCVFVEDSKGNPDLFGASLLRHASTVELNAKRRLSLTEQALGEVS